MKLVTFDEKSILKRVLDNNGVIAFPTETVFGLGANSLSNKAFDNLVKVKDRSPDKPFTLMCYSMDQVKDFVYINEIAQKLINKFMPGSITLLLEAKKDTPFYLHLNSKYIGVRIPGEERLLSFLEYYGKPLLVPSANKSNEPPATSIKEVFNYFEGEIEYCVAGVCSTNLASTIIQVDEQDIKVIRRGPITEEEIRKELE
jgi:L-threonylcarbamoyladenylate synthase